MFQSSSSTSAKAHKSKIIGDAIQMYTRLMKQKEVLEAEIAFSSAEKLNEWVNKVSCESKCISFPKPPPHSQPRP